MTRTILPLWYHPGVTNCPMTNVPSRCLLKNHTAKSIEDLIKLSNKLQVCQRCRNHQPTPACICPDCIQDCQSGCRNPHKCTLEAKACIQDIAPKYNLLTAAPVDNLSLTPNRKARNIIALQQTKM